MIEDGQGSFTNKEDKPLTFEILMKAKDLLDNQKFYNYRYFAMPYYDKQLKMTKLFIGRYGNKKTTFFLDSEEISHEQGEEILKSIYGPLIKEKE